MHDPDRVTEVFAGDADADRTVRLDGNSSGPTVAVGPNPGGDRTVAIDRTAGMDPTVGADPTSGIAARDDSTGFTAPHSFGQSTDFPPRPAAPIALPQRIPAQFAPPPRDWNASSTSRSLEPPSKSIHIGSGVVAATPRRDLRPVTRRWWGYLTRVLSALATLVLVAAAVWTGWQWWEHYHDKVAVSSVTVAPIRLPKGTCDVQYDVVGTITTNGKAGTVTYEWLRSDGQRSGVLSESVASGETSTVVHLYWTFTGHGSVTARATLRVLTPDQKDGSAQFPYSCA